MEFHAGGRRQALWITGQRERMHVTPLGFCLSVIVKEKPLNLETTTSSVLSVSLLIFGQTLAIHSFKKSWVKPYFFLFFCILFLLFCNLVIYKFKKINFILFYFFVLFKGTVSVILSDPPCKDGKALFTTVH